MDQNDIGGICDGLRALFESQRQHAVTGSMLLDTLPNILCVVARSLEWSSFGDHQIAICRFLESPFLCNVLHDIFAFMLSSFAFMLSSHSSLTASTFFRSYANVEIGELASGWLALVLDNPSVSIRELVHTTPGLISGLCRLGESGSAQARIFAGICLQQTLKAGGAWRAESLIGLTNFPPCINSLLCSPVQEERLSGTLILAELIQQGGEEAVQLIFGNCAVALASLLSNLSESIQTDGLVGLWCVGRLARTRSGRKALKEADTIDLLRRWSKTADFVGPGKDPEHMLTAQVDAHAK